MSGLGEVMPMGNEVRLALHAALDEPDAATQAWNALRSTVDLDTCWDGDILRLLPLVWKNLVASGGGRRDVARLGGVYRHNWYHGQHTIESAAMAHDALAQAGVGVRMVGGVSLVERYYDGPGDRRIDDTAFVVAPTDLERATSVLVENRWVPTVDRRSGPAGRFSVPRHFTLTDHRGSARIAVSVTPNPWCAQVAGRVGKDMTAGVNAEMTADAAAAGATAATPAILSGAAGSGGSDGRHLAITQNRAVSAEVQLMVTLLGGPTGTACVGQAWIADVVHLVRSGTVDAKRFTTVAMDHGVGPLLAPGLETIEAEFNVSVGKGVTSALRRGRLTRRARWASTATPAGRLGGVAIRWARATHNDGLLPSVGSLPAFIAEQAGVHGPGGLPAEALRRLGGTGR
jgi:hypothetical protein